MIRITTPAPISDDSTIALISARLGRRGRANSHIATIADSSSARFGSPMIAVTERTDVHSAARAGSQVRSESTIVLVEMRSSGITTGANDNTSGGSATAAGASVSTPG